MKTKMGKAMKKVMVYLLVLSMCAPLIFATKSVSAKGYYFEYSDVSVTMGSKAKKLIKAAGKPIAYKKKKSCAFKGYDRTRQYSSFILKTYSNSKKGAEFVNGITFTSSSIKTKEGIHIGSTKKEVTDAYGAKNPNIAGVMIYTKGKTKLLIQIENDKVTKLMYNLK